MLALPASRTASRSAVQSVPVPAPVGWYARDPISQMQPGQCVRLDNWIRRADGLEIRLGKVKLGTFGGAIQSLLVYRPRNGFPRVFGASPTALYSVGRTAGGLEAAAISFGFDIAWGSGVLTWGEGAVDEPVVSGLGSGVWSSAMQTNSGGDFLMGVNGADGVKVFNGTSWSTSTVTSAQANRTVSAANFFAMCIHMRRPFLAEKNSLRLWYLGVDTIGGPAHCLDLAPLCRNGGHIVALASMTTDGARSANDRLCVVTSEGEMVVYGGIDPLKATSWSLVGVFGVPFPAGKRCLIRYGGDLAYLSADGLLPVSKLMATPDPDKPLVAMTDPIRNAYRQGVLIGQGSEFLGLAESTRHRLILVNMPTDAGSVQFVKSADVGTSPKTRGDGWSRFTGFDALCWAEVGNDLYFGADDGSVYRYAGNTDDGDPITAYSVEAYSRFKHAGKKVFSRVRPIFNNGAPIKARARMALRTDYASIPETLTAPSGTFANTNWTWDTLTAWTQTPAQWVRDIIAQVQGWRGISGHGHSASLELSVTATGPVKYEGSEIMFQAGGQI